MEHPLQKETNLKRLKKELRIRLIILVSFATVICALAGANQKTFKKVPNLASSAPIGINTKIPRPDLNALIANTPFHATEEELEYVRNNYTRPSTLLKEKLSDPDIQLIGISSRPDRPEPLKLLAQMIRNNTNEQNNIDFVAVDIDSSLQEKVNDYMESGKMSIELQKAIFTTPTGYNFLLDISQKEGIRILCLGGKGPAEKVDIIETILNDGRKKGVMYSDFLTINKEIWSQPDRLFFAQALSYDQDYLSPPVVALLGSKIYRLTALPTSGSSPFGGKDFHIGADAGESFDFYFILPIRGIPYSNTGSFLSPTHGNS